jgi:two-component system response regulator LytT
MKLTIQQDSSLDEVEVTIRCPQMDEAVLRMAAVVRTYDSKLTGMRQGQTYLLNPGNVCFVQTQEGKSCIYTLQGVYESTLRLFELERVLAEPDFFRASKWCIVNFRRVVSIRPQMGGRMTLKMENGESVDVSRQYAGWVRAKLAQIERSAKDGKE